MSHRITISDETYRRLQERKYGGTTDEQIAWMLRKEEIDDLYTLLSHHKYLAWVEFGGVHPGLTDRDRDELAWLDAGSIADYKAAKAARRE